MTKRRKPTVPDKPLGQRLNRVTKSVIRSAMRDYQRVAALTFVEAVLLKGLGSLGPISGRVLSDYVDLHEGQASKAIQSLVAKGLISRASNPADARCKVLMMTEEGAAAYRAIRKVQGERQKRLMEGISDEDLAQFLQTLEMIAINAESLEQQERPAKGAMDPEMPVAAAR